MMVSEKTLADLADWLPIMIDRFENAVGIVRVGELWPRALSVEDAEMLLSMREAAAELRVHYPYRAVVTNLPTVVGVDDVVD